MSCAYPDEEQTSPDTPTTVGQTAFVAPIPLPNPHVVVEFCDRCRWLHRATWVQTELFLTFPSVLKGISLVPLNAEDTAGRFRIWLITEAENTMIWDRKTGGGFPELKVLKQRIRDHVQPGMSLGHSDTTKTHKQSIVE